MTHLSSVICTVGVSSVFSSKEWRKGTVVATCPGGGGWETALAEGAQGAGGSPSRPHSLFFISALLTLVSVFST